MKRNRPEEKTFSMPFWIRTFAEEDLLLDDSRTFNIIYDGTPEQLSRRL